MLGLWQGSCLFDGELIKIDNKHLFSVFCEYGIENTKQIVFVRD